MDKFDRYPGETDAELRVRIVDTPIIKEARNAFWRLQAVKNPDMLEFVTINGKQYAVVDIDITDLTFNSPTNVLGQFEPVEFSCTGYRESENADE